MTNGITFREFWMFSFLTGSSMTPHVTFRGLSEGFTHFIKNINEVKVNIHM